MTTRLAALALSSAAVTSACVDVGQTPVDFPLYLVGTASEGEIAGRDGVTLELERAELAFGPFYLCAGANAGDLCEAARLEWLESTVLDVLDPNPRLAGQATGVSGPVNSYMFDLGISAQLAQNQPLVLPAAAELGGVSLVLEGRAFVDDQALNFSARVAAQQQEETELGIPVIRSTSEEPFGHEVEAGEAGLLVRFDASEWVTQIDFRRLLEASSCAIAGPVFACSEGLEQRCGDDGSVTAERDCSELGLPCVTGLGCTDTIEFQSDSQGHRAIRNQLTAGSRPSFRWGFRP